LVLVSTVDTLRALLSVTSGAGLLHSPFFEIDHSDDGAEPGGYLSRAGQERRFFRADRQRGMTQEKENSDCNARKR